MGMEVRVKEGEEDQIGSGRKASRTTCRRKNCQGRTRKTGHKSGKRYRRRRRLPTKINGIMIVFKVND